MEGTYVLNNGVEIPTIGMGTGIILPLRPKPILEDIRNNQGFRAKKIFTLSKVIRQSYTYGLKMFDTSREYGGCERLLGKAIKDKDRKDIFIITKISNADQKKGNVRESLYTSLKELNVDYIDLYMLHWPKKGTYVDTWLQMEELYKEGLIRAIGVSNFHKQHFKELLSKATIMPVVNEIERHPLMSQKPLIEYCEKMGIRIIAYTPLGRMHDKLRTNKILIDIATKYKKTIPQIILKWHIQQGVIPIPSTTKKNRVREYAEVFEFNLTLEDIEKIDSINEDFRLRFDPDNCKFTS